MNPDELLAQIRSLLDQYLQLGAGTPVESEAQALAAAIDQTSGGGGAPPEAGGMPPEGMPPEPSMMSGADQMPDMTGGVPLDQMQSGGYGSFADANAALTGDIKKRIKGR
jgi:hypothetical protein